MMLILPIEAQGPQLEKFEMSVGKPKLLDGAVGKNELQFS
jgi:hypothetical protein